jgi:hypothetical protein
MGPLSLLAANPDLLMYVTAGKLVGPSGRRIVNADRVTRTMRFGYDGDRGPGDRLVGVCHRSTSCHTTR